MSELPNPDRLPMRAPWQQSAASAVVGLGPDGWEPVAFDDRTWRRSAACRHEDPALFFPVGATGHAVEEIAAAKAVCARCPVRLACLRYALVTHQEFGVWGGHDEDERRVLRRKWRTLGHPFPVVRSGLSDRSGPAPGPRLGRRVDRAHRVS